MRLEWFRAQGFRSVLDVELDLAPPAGPVATDPADWVAVFRGPNGAGKSNVLRAIRAWFGLFRGTPWPGPCSPPARRDFDRSDFARQSLGATVLDGRLVGLAEHARRVGLPNPRGFDRLRARFELSPAQDVGLHAAEVLLDGQDLARIDMADTTTELRVFWGRLCRSLAEHGLGYLPAFRGLREETAGLADGQEPASAARTPRVEHPVDGLQKLLSDASRSPDAVRRRGFRQFEEFVRGPPLSRGRLSFEQDAEGGLTLLEERALGDLTVDMPVRSLGSGEQEALSILALAMVPGASVVAVEEPEAHLYWSTQRTLRAALERLCLDETTPPGQFLVETHSHEFVFGTRYFDVSMVDGATRVERRPNPEAHRHFHEPGPVRDALRDLLRVQLRPDEPLYTPAGKEPVTAARMLDLLERGDPAADEFLQVAARAVLSAVAAEARSRRGGA